MKEPFDQAGFEWFVRVYEAYDGDMDQAKADTDEEVAERVRQYEQLMGEEDNFDTAQYFPSPLPTHKGGRTRN